MARMLRNSPVPPIFSTIQSGNKLDYRSSKELVQHYLQLDEGKGPKLIIDAVEDFDNYNLAISSLGNSISK
jgi:hypothetical protein